MELEIAGLEIAGLEIAGLEIVVRLTLHYVKMTPIVQNDGCTISSKTTNTLFVRTPQI